MDEKERHVTLVFITKILPVITIRYKVWLFSFESKMSVLQYGDLFFWKKRKEKYDAKETMGPFGMYV